jgi:anti-anti-sigma factor
MSVTTTLDADLLTIQVSGRFDFSIHNEFRLATKQAESNAKRIVVDLSNTDYLDSSALGMLLVLRDKAGNTPIKIIGARAEVKKILEIANFDKLFTVP